jgi:hypothetical protein
VPGLIDRITGAPVFQQAECLRHGSHAFPACIILLPSPPSLPRPFPHPRRPKLPQNKIHEAKKRKRKKNPKNIAKMRRLGEEKTCDFCLSRGQQLLVCSRCRNVRYCSRPCQKAHWKEGHKLECSPCNDTKMDATCPPKSEKWMVNHSRQHDIASSSINYLSIVKELFNEVQRDSISLDEAHSRMRRAQDEVLRLTSELKVMRESRRSKIMKTRLPVRTRNCITSDIKNNDCVKENNVIQNNDCVIENHYKQTKIFSPALVQAVHNRWKLLVEDLTNINCYSIFLSPFSQQTTDIPKENTLCLSIIPSSSSSSCTQVTLRHVDDNDDLHSSDTAVDPTLLLLSINLPGAAMDSNGIRLATHVDCITLRLMYDKEHQRHLEYQHTLPKTTSFHLLKDTLACKSCQSKLLIDSVHKVEKILPLPSGYWDEVADYLMCYEGVSHQNPLKNHILSHNFTWLFFPSHVSLIFFVFQDSTIAFSSSSYNTAIKGCILEDSSVFVMHKEYLGSNVEVLAIEGYGEPFEHPMRKSNVKLSENTYQNNSCNVPLGEEAPGRANTVPDGGGGVLFRGERRWRDLTGGGGGATLCCSQCCSILGFASHAMDSYLEEPPFRLYKHRLTFGTDQHSKNTFGTFIAHQMVRYAEGQAVFTFYIMMEKSSCRDRLALKPNCLLLKLLSWDTRIAVFNQEEETYSDSCRFENAVKVVFQEKIQPYEVDPLPLSPLLFWNNIDLCCPPQFDQSKESRNSTSVYEKNSDGIDIQRTTASVKIFLSWDEWNELRHELISKRFPNSIVAGTFQMKCEISSSSEGFYEGVSFLPLN